MQPKGDIQIGEIVLENGVELKGKEIILRLQSREFSLMADNVLEAKEWADTFSAWVKFMSSP